MIRKLTAGGLGRRTVSGLLFGAIACCLGCDGPSEAANTPRLEGATPSAPRDTERCKGSNERASCERIEAAIAMETSEQANLRRSRLEQERARNMADVMSQPVAPQQQSPSAWVSPEVEAAAIVAMPKSYEGTTIKFRAVVLGALQPDGAGRSRLYIDDYPYLTPIFQGAIVERWLSAGLMPRGQYVVTFEGRVAPKAYGTFIDFMVSDFTLDR